MADSKRKNWVMTYGASSGYIDFKMFNDEGSLDVDEVHSTSDGAFVYTYFHLKTSVRQSTIKKFMGKMNHAHGFVLSDVFGYDSVDGGVRGKSLTEHIVIQMLFEHMKEKNPAFVACTNGMPGVSKGILMECNDFSRIREVISKRAKLLVPVLDIIEGQYNDIKKKYEISSEQVEEEYGLTYDVMKKRRAIEAPDFSRIREVISKRAKLLVPVLDRIEGQYNDIKKKYEISSEQVEEENGLTYDVVKKRRAMEAPENEHEENAPEALVAFEDFEQSVLNALENIRSDEEEFRKHELMEMEEGWAKGEAQPKTGGVYFAWSDCLKCMKIGATRREDPLVRLREISRYVTTPFVLTAWIPTLSPFRQEAAAHRFFNEKRINFRGSGAGTEFFHVTTAEAVGYVSYSRQYSMLRLPQ